MNTITVTETATVQADSDKAAQDAAQQARAVVDQAQAAALAGEAASSEPQAPAAELRFIALSRLRLSKRNVRKTAVPVGALADSIGRVGLLQNLIVVSHADGESFEVVAGARRWAALRLLAKSKRIARDQSIPCLVVPDARAVTVSLTENVQRQDMHPADQFEALRLDPGTDSYWYIEIAHQWIGWQNAIVNARTQEVAPQLAERDRLREALTAIEQWKVPLVEFRGEVVSMSIADGDNGVRDYFRGVARAALQEESHD